jgi:hypothetical protein
MNSNTTHHCGGALSVHGWGGNQLHWSLFYLLFASEFTGVIISSLPHLLVGTELADSQSPGFYDVGASVGMPHKAYLQSKVLHARKVWGSHK